MFKKIIANIAICVFALCFGIVFAAAVESYHGYDDGSCKCHPHKHWNEYHRELIDYYKDIENKEYYEKTSTKSCL